MVNVLRKVNIALLKPRDLYSQFFKLVEEKEECACVRPGEFCIIEHNPYGFVCTYFATNGPTNHHCDFRNEVSRPHDLIVL